MASCSSQWHLNMTTIAVALEKASPFIVTQLQPSALGCSGSAHLSHNQWERSLILAHPTCRRLCTQLQAAKMSNSKPSIQLERCFVTPLKQDQNTQARKKQPPIDCAYAVLAHAFPISLFMPRAILEYDQPALTASNCERAQSSQGPNTCVIQLMSPKSADRS